MQYTSPGDEASMAMDATEYAHEFQHSAIAVG